MMKKKKKKKIRDLTPNESRSDEGKKGSTLQERHVMRESFRNRGIAVSRWQVARKDLHVEFSGGSG
jgi:hypothetical protein